jgi:hypothetical protein
LPLQVENLPGSKVKRRKKKRFKDGMDAETKEEESEGFCKST